MPQIGGMGKMETHPLDGPEELEEHYGHEVPEDVAILYSWANLEGAKYQDFSANRREYRAQMRQRAAEQMRLIEAQAREQANVVAKQAEADSSAVDATAKQAAERVSGQESRDTNLGGHAWADSQVGFDESGARDESAKQVSFRTASQEARRAAAEREAATRGAEAAAFAAMLDRQAEQGGVDAQALGTRQAARYAEAGLRGRLATSLDSGAPVAEKTKYPHNPEPKLLQPAHATNSAETGESRVEVVTRIVSSDSSGSLPKEGPKAFSQHNALAGVSPSPETLVQAADGAVGKLSSASSVADTPLVAENEKQQTNAASRETEPRTNAGPDPRQHDFATHTESIPIGPPEDLPESLHQSERQTATRWFALRALFAHNDGVQTTDQPITQAKAEQAPILAVFSIAGGVGKTSLVAALGRSLSSLGERVLLNETATHGPLPFYFGSFGSRENASGEVRVFVPPAGVADAPIRLVSYAATGESREAAREAGIVEDMLEKSQRTHRVLMDLSVHCSNVVGKLGRFKPTILVPLIPDINSVISIDAIEKLFSSTLDAEGQLLQPVYLLNQFDVSLPLHRDIRELLQQQLGKRLLPFVIRHSTAVGEALAEGMTIVDYAPDSGVAEDYLRAAHWLRSASAPVAAGFANQRWSEQ